MRAGRECASRIARLPACQLKTARLYSKTARPPGHGLLIFPHQFDMFAALNIAVSCPLPNEISLQEVKTWIYRLGGSYHEQVYETTQVLCSTDHRIRYLHQDAFRATQLRAAVVSFEWLQGSYDQGKFLPVSHYLLNTRRNPKYAPLTGCVIAFTSSFPLPKGSESYDGVRNAIIRLGGTHRTGVRPDVLTHFCVTEKGTQSARLARPARPHA